MMTRKFLIIGGVILGLGILAGAGFIYKAKTAIAPAQKAPTATKEAPLALPKEVTVPLFNNEQTPNQKDLVSFTGTIEKLPSCLANLLCFKLIVATPKASEIYATEWTPAKIGVAKVFPSDSFLEQYLGKKVTLTGTTIPAQGATPSYLRVYKLVF